MLSRLVFFIAVLSLRAPLIWAQDAALEKQVAELRELVVMLQSRVDQLEKREVVPKKPDIAFPVIAVAPRPDLPPPPTPATSATTDVWGGTTLNLFLDGYYGYNFNKPIGRVNLLRAYDVSSNAFSLNQAGLVLENAPDVSKGKRWGARLDLQFGQATQTLQGNPTNELRPEIYRAIFQAYGTYVFPVVKGLTVDVGKFASSLGIEGNYTKDQINYSRAYWFNFLPYYHEGVRASLKLNDAVSLNYWLVNSIQGTEPNNGFKDEFFGVTTQPFKNVTWNINYYFGQEHPDVIFYPSGGAPQGSPTLQGVGFQPITNALRGRLHIFDSYLTWNLTPKLTLAADFDYVIQRDNPSSSPQHTDGTAGYIRYQLSPKLAFAARTEYLSDRGGLFSGKTQALKEDTATVEYRLADGFLLRNEWRRDYSNQKYFYTNTLGILKKQQTTAMIGLVWWFGQKQGSW
jgi:hypothetical protein